jgi:cold shock CspA family protein
MRLQGRLSEWNGDRGFGFVTQNGTGKRHFLHVSQWQSRHSRPQVGDTVTYEVGADERGRPQARNARMVGVGRASPGKPSAGAGTVVVSLAIVGALAYVGYVRVSAPNSTLQSAAYKAVFAREALKPDPRFQCRPEKNSCSKMTSCAEAIFHLEHCGVQGMDGDHDGIPCESQWCN